ncbi:MAG: hypothetical protein K9L28_05680, partial [Synergistales bacterium]|nr:hypothetical protein [Synergistales bacterium]
TVRICFGSKKLFRAQFDVEKSGYASHNDWLQHWRASRNAQFFVLGSKEETGGCQGCVATPLGGRRFSFRLRLPGRIVPANEGRKYVTFTAPLPYGADVLEDSLQTGRAVNYRFLRDERGWRLFVTTERTGGTPKTSRSSGAIGIDINADHLAVAETDRCGNLIHHRAIPLVTYGCSTDQAKARIGNAVAELMAFADGKGKPLVVERLDFADKKARMEDQSHRYARMLSSFSYNRIRANIRARAFDRGIAVYERNPAYSSVIGRWKFNERYGISGHVAAALVIARRGMSRYGRHLSERPNRRDRNALLLPARNRGRHVWSFWRKVARKEAALAARRRSAKRQEESRSPRSGSQQQPKIPTRETTPSAAGAIPAREPSPVPFG